MIVHILQAVNFGEKSVNMKVEVTGLFTKLYGSKKKVLTSASVMDENSFSNPEMVNEEESITHDLGLFLF